MRFMLPESCGSREAGTGRLSTFDTVTDRLQATAVTSVYLQIPNRAAESNPSQFRVRYSDEAARLWEDSLFLGRLSTPPSQYSPEVSNMKHAFAAFALALFSLTTPLAMSLEPREAAAESASRAWLALVDAGSYAESWSAASALFRQKVPKAQWQSAASNARGPLGALKSRTLQSATFKSTLPGAPDGEYVIVQFASSFEDKASAIETVTPMKDQDGTWRVSGYYIR